MDTIDIVDDEVTETALRLSAYAFIVIRHLFTYSLGDNV